LKVAAYPGALLKTLHGGIVDGLARGQFSAVDQIAQGRSHILDGIDDHHLGIGLSRSQRAGSSLNCLSQLS